MKCSNCGNEIRPEQRFCAYCGTEQSQQDVFQGEPSVSPPPSFGGAGNGSGINSNEKKIILTVFSVICGAVYGLIALRGVRNVISALAQIVLGFRYGFFSNILWIFLGIILGMLGIISALWICLSLMLMAFRRTGENSDGLLLCICGGGIVRVLLFFLNAVIDIIVYHYGFKNIIGSVCISIVGAAVTVGGIYLILRFLLGENPISGKTPQELQDEVKSIFSNLRGIVNMGGGKKETVTYPQDQVIQGQGMPFQSQTMHNNQPLVNAEQIPNYQMPPNGPALFRLKTDRSLLMYIVLSLFTCGIYGWYFIYALARDINVACDGDGSTTGGLIKFILLSTITCGIYGWIWYYGVGNRLAANAPRYGMIFQENGTTILLWMLFGSMLCGIGPFISMHIIIKNTNMICGAYNHAHHM